MIGEVGKPLLPSSGDFDNFVFTSYEGFSVGYSLTTSSVVAIKAEDEIGFKMFASLTPSVVSSTKKKNKKNNDK